MRHRRWWSAVRSSTPSTAVTLYLIRNVPDAALDRMETVPASLNCASDAVEDVAVPVPARWVHQEFALSARTMTPVNIRTEHMTPTREYRTMTPPVRG